jgi:hypothetical protein
MSQTAMTGYFLARAASWLAAAAINRAGARGDRSVFARYGGQ